MRLPTQTIAKIAPSNWWQGIVLFLILTAAYSVHAQNPVQPKRGFYPAGSYALSDIESINTTNGNVILRIPLASLPAGRGGAAGLGLYYNSKPYETWSYEDGRFEDGSYSSVLRASDAGGWRYGFRYDVQLIHRFDDNQPLHPVCYANETVHVWKVKVKFPDGSEHIFRPSGYTDPLADNYFQIQPDGWLQGACGQADQYVIPTGMTYYSADGSFMKLQFAPDGGDHNWANNAWTLSLPDGTRVTGGPAPQRIYDRNNNFIEIRNITYNGHPASEIIDELGRHIIAEYDYTTGRDYVRAWRTENGQLTELVWTITGGGASASDNSYYLNPNDIAYGNTMYGPGYAVVRRIDLPAQAGGLSYTFAYSSDDPGTGWGELSAMTLPSGAQVNYSYSTYSYTLLAVDVLRNYVSQKQVTYQAEYDGTSTPINDTWQYLLSEYNGVMTAPDGGVTHEHFYQTNVDSWSSGLVYKTENPDGSVVERIWQQNIPYGYGTSYPKANPYTKTEFTSIKNAVGALVSTAIKDYTYDKNGNVTQLAEYDWVSYGDVPRGYGGIPTGIPWTAQIKRISSSTFYNSTPTADSSAYDPDIYTQGSAPAICNAFAASEVSDGTQTLSRVEFFYDNPATTGNLIQKTVWDSTKGGYTAPLTSGNSISTSTQYNAYGSPILATDARGYQTEFVYGSVGGFTDLYPTQIKTAFGTAVQRTEAREYDFHSGLVTRVNDVDNNVSTATSYDVFGRPILVRAAEGKPEETRTATEYSDTARRVIVRSDLNTIGDGRLVSIQHYDQLGRVRLARELEDSTTQSAYDETLGIKVQTRYAFSGANSFVVTSNPYRANFSSNAGGESTMGWTRTKDDNGGKVIEVQTFGGASLPAPWGGNSTGTGAVLTAYDANFTTVTDQAGKIRRSMTDALGRLIRVDEPGDPNVNNSLGSTSAPQQPTSYSYDALDNLTSGNQGSQTRTFVYDSLKRLTSATNPESGTVSYQYDENGNLRFKTDARGVLTEHRYDGLNRVFVTLYRVNGQPDPNTGDVEYLYDNATNGKGRPWLTLTHGSSPFHTAVGSYDALGRVTQLNRCFALWCGSLVYSTSATYDLAGHVKTMTYPSGRSVTYNYDGAGRLADKDAQNLAFTGNLGDGVARTYARGISYSSFGGMTIEQFGTQTPLYHKLQYNVRGQLWDVRVATGADVNGSWNRGALQFFYDNSGGFGTSGPENNGNVLKSWHYIPMDDQYTNWAIHRDSYSYDSLNRIASVTENFISSTEAENQKFAQIYNYDRYANRTISDATWGAPEPQFGVDTSTNRLTPPGGYTMSYDPAGNLTNDTYTGQGSRTYDAENRMKQAWANNQWQTYAYDGNGARVKRIVNGVETWQLYGIGGELLAEYAVNSAPTMPQKEYGYRNGELLITVSMATTTGYVGCFTDDPNRALPASLSTGGETVESCNQKAAAAGYAYSGVQWYGQCFAGNTVGYVQVSDSECNTPCTANTSQMCGGAWRNSIYKTVNIRWLVADQLGTPRMIFDQSGSLANVSRHDYLPFGEELFAYTGGRTPAQGYTPSDGVRQKFTSKERDNETGLDYFLARYYSSAQGRFTSPDEFSGGPDELYDFADDASENPTFYAELNNPQSLNKYQYTYNNPVNLTDDDGHVPCRSRACQKAAEVAKKNSGLILDVTQAVISVAGLIPGAGEPADLVNAGISTARGNLGEAGLDLAGALGPVGSAAAVGNRVRKIVKAASKADDLVDAGRATRKTNIEVRHSSRKEAREAAEHPHPGKKLPTPPKSDTKKRRQYEEQQRYRKPERHPNSKHPESHFHDRDKSKNKRVTVHHTYPE